MRKWLQFALIFHILIEMVIPFVVLFSFPIWNAYFLEKWLPGHAWQTDVFLAFLLTLMFYLPMVVKVNMRRFPRVGRKIILVFGIPLLTEIIIAIVSGLSGINLLFLLGLHTFSALLFAMFFEAIQRSRVRAVQIPPFFAGIFLVAGMVVLLSMQCMAFTLVLPSLSFVGKGMFIFIWFLGIAQMTILKFQQAGKKLYAEKGYRPNAAVIVMNEKGQVLLCERANRPGKIQTIQGGIDPGETPEEAARRELTEEIGVWPAQYEMKAAMLEAKRYDWSSELKKKLAHTGYKGQEQYFFLVQVDSSVSFDLAFHHREFRRVWWDTPEQLVRLSWSKKRPGIEAALKGFGLLEKKKK